MTKKIFLSYSGKDSDIANEIDSQLIRFNVEVIRDIRDLEYNATIHSFMDSVSNMDKVIMIVSDNFLKSICCMYEAYQSLSLPDFQKKILPVLVDTNFNKKSYIAYWNEVYIEVLNNKYDLQELEDIMLVQKCVGPFIDFLLRARRFPSNSIDYYSFLSALDIEFKYPNVFTKDFYNWFLSQSQSDFFTLESFVGDLFRSKTLKISDYPNEPQNERSYYFKRVEFQKTVFGISMILQLIQKDSGDSFAIPFNDITRIEESSFGSPQHSKYYIDSIVRDKKRVYEYLENKEQKSGVNTLSEHEKEILCEGFTDTYRLIILFS